MVIVELEEPSATDRVGLAVTVERLAETEPGSIVTEPLVPVIEGVTVSVAVIVFAPAEVNEAPPVKVWLPLSPARKA